MFNWHVGRNVGRNLGKGLATGLVAGGCLLAFGSAAFAQSTKPADVVVTVAGDQAQATSEPGVLIVAVEPASPAAKAGLQRGDVVLKVGDIAVNNLPELRTTLATMAAGDEVSLTVQHGDETNTLELTLGERNGQAFLGIRPYSDAAMTPSVQIQRGGPLAPQGAAPAQPGMLARPAQPGIQVVKVEENSPAATAGIQVGDVIIALNGEAAVADGNLRQLLRSLKPGDKVTLTIQPAAAGEGAETGAETNEVTVTLGENPQQQGVGYFGMQIAHTALMLREQGPGFPPGFTPGFSMPRRFQEHCAQMEGRGEGGRDQRGHRPKRFMRRLCNQAGMGGEQMRPGFFATPSQEQFFLSAPLPPTADMLFFAPSAGQAFTFAYPPVPGEDGLFFYDEGVAVSGSSFALPVPGEDMMQQALPEFSVPAPLPRGAEEQIEVIAETL